MLNSTKKALLNLVLKGEETLNNSMFDTDHDEKIKSIIYRNLESIRKQLFKL